MKSKVALLLTIGIIIGFGIGYVYFKYKTYSAFDTYFGYFEKIPEFNNAEAEFIKKNICNIYKQVDEPEKYYISSVTIGKKVLVKMDAIQKLQNGETSNKTFISFSSDGYYTLEFDLNGNFLAYK